MRISTRFCKKFLQSEDSERPQQKKHAKPAPGPIPGAGFYVEESSRGTAACGDDMRSFGDAHNVFDILLCLTLFSFSRDAGTAHGVHRVADRV